MIGGGRSWKGRILAQGLLNWGQGWGCSSLLLLLGSQPGLLCREADRVILTSCQEKGAHLDTFHAISQKLGNKTASEVRGGWERGWGGREGVSIISAAQISLGSKIISFANKKKSSSALFQWCPAPCARVSPGV